MVFPSYQEFDNLQLIVLSIPTDVLKYFIDIIWRKKNLSNQKHPWCNFYKHT